MKSRLFKFYLLGFLLIIFVSFTWAEILVRATIPYRDLFELTGRIPTRVGNEWGVTDAFAAYKGKPGFSYEEEALTKTINSYGFISTPEMPLEKEEHTVRVVFLGGSSTAGTGINLSDSETWPWRVMMLLKERYAHLNFDFINAAIGGYTTFESYGRLWSRLRFFDPDIVIVNHGWNDMSYFSHKKYDEIIKFREGEAGEWQYNRPQLRKFYKPTSFDVVLRYSQALTYLRLMMATPLSTGEMTANDPNDVLARTFESKGLKIYADNLGLIQSAVDRMDAKLFVIKQPTLIVPNLSSELREECGYHNHGFDHDAHVMAYQGIYDIIDEGIVAADIIDLRNLSGNPDYFYDHVHPTYPLGINAYASQVAKAISHWIDKNDLSFLKNE